MNRTKSRIFDEYLVASSRAGDRQAFELLAGRWHRKLVAHAWRITGNIEEARDAAQTAWIEIGRGLDRLRDDRAFPAWAYRITSRACARQIKGEIRRRRVSEALSAQPDEQADEAGAKIDADRLRAAIRRLPPDQRAAIGLYHFEELSVAEVAVALDVPAGTVKTRLMHARRRLRAVLEGED